MDKMAEGPGPLVGPPPLTMHISSTVERSHPTDSQCGAIYYITSSLRCRRRRRIKARLLFSLQSVGHGQKSMSAVLYSLCIACAERAREAQTQDDLVPSLCRVLQ